MSTPSTALNTEMAGVIIAWPKNSDAPPRPMIKSALRVLPRRRQDERKQRHRALLRRGCPHAPKQVGQEKPDRQSRISDDPEHEGRDRKPEKRHFDQGPVRSLQREEERAPEHVEDDVDAE